MSGTATMEKPKQEKDAYLLKRDFKSSNRLNFNHWLLKELSGYLLHPRIDPLGNQALVADVAAGTGIWLLETAASLPKSVQFHGFDISPDQFPPKPWRPSNVQLSAHDMFNPFPEEFLGKFDVVHAQLLICLINDGDAEIVLEHLVSLLKPGGQLQWFEPNSDAMRIHCSTPGASTTAVEKLASMFKKPFPNSSYNWITEMPSLFEKSGIRLEAHDQYAMKEHLRLPFAQSTLAGMEDVIPGLEVDGTQQGEAMRELMQKLDSEFRNGVSLDFTYQCFVGRKPF